MTRVHQWMVTGMALGLAWMLAGAPVSAAESSDITSDNVVERIMAAKTVADHLALAAFYRSQAQAEAEQVKRHEQMMKAYAQVGGKPQVHMGEHCQALIRSHKQQQEYEQLASAHDARARSMAQKR